MSSIKSVHPLIMPWLLLLHRHLFYRAWIRRLPSYMVLLWSIQPVFSESSVLWPALSSSILFHCTHQATPLASAWVARTVQTGYLNFQLKALHTGRPPHLTDLLQHHQPTKSLRSSSSHQLFIPRHYSHCIIWISCFPLFSPNANGSGTPCLSTKKTRTPLTGTHE